MPRFDNEGFNPDSRINNDSRDRSVPEMENYYGKSNDFRFNDPVSDSPVIDNQQKWVDINSYGDIEPPVRNQRQQQSGYTPEVLRDFDREQRQQNLYDRRNQPTPKKPKKRRRKKINKPKKILYSILAIILIIILLLSLVVNGILGKIKYDDPIENKYVASSELKHSPFVKNILLLGVDARPNQESETSRADSMMLISIDMKHKCVKMTSFLRDSWVYIPSHEGEQRLNAASAYGGYNGVVDTIEYNFGVDVDGYIVADFEMFKVLVDSIGGVEIDVTEAEAREVTRNKIRYGNVKLEAGKHKLTGEQALAYCRIRKIDTDFVRTKRQRTVIQSILNKAKKNPLRLFSMASNSAGYLETNLTKGQLKRAAAAGTYCITGDMLQEKIPFEHTWEYANKSGMSVIAINIEKNKEKLIDYIYNKTAEEIKAEQE
ncbi:MAG: LCP family protein [Eubacterium sp.]|nr:LCP family protein [Eubacterium sp.]